MAAFAAVLVALVMRGITGEVLDPPPPLNDTVLHQSLAHGASLALERGADPTDFWFPEVALGFPAFHHYQHLPHVAIAWIARTTGASIEAVYGWAAWWLLLALPLSIGWTVHRLARDKLAGWCAVALAAVVSTPGLYGLDLTSFGWAGSGLATQLWGAVLLGPTWVALRRAIGKGRGIAIAGVLVGALVLTHTVLGWVAAMTAVAFALAGPASFALRRGGASLRECGRAFGLRGVRLGAIGALAFALTAYFVVPFLLDHAAMNRSEHELQTKYDAYGAAATLAKLVRGELFDWNMAGAIDEAPIEGGRSGRPRVRARVLPLITLLLGVGLVMAVVTGWRRRRVPVLAALFVGWFVLYFGPATFGDAIRWLPLAGDLHFHRLIVPVHLAGVGVAAVALATAATAFVDWATPRWSTRTIVAVVAVGVVGAFAGPVLERTQWLLRPGALPHERTGYLDFRARWALNTKAAFRTEGVALERAVGRLRSIAKGRVYAGLAADWGAHYRVGTVPVYALLTGNGLPSVGYLYHAMSLSADLMVYFNDVRPAHYNLMNVRHVLAPRDGRSVPKGTRMLIHDKRFHAFAKPAFVEGAHVIFEVPTTGYFDLVSAPWAATGDRASWYRAMRTWILSTFVESKQHPICFVGTSPADGHEAAISFDVLEKRFHAAPPGPRRRGRVTQEILRPDEFEARFEVREPCYLMLKQSYHPGWRVRVGEREVTPVMVAPAYCAVPVRPGDTRAVFTYRPPGSRRPLRIAGVVIAALAIVGEWGWRRRRKSRAGGSRTTKGGAA